MKAAGHRPRAASRRTPAAGRPVLAGVLLIVLAGCGGSGGVVETAPPPRRFPAPIFDGLSLGMPREAVARVHPIRPALTSAGKSRRVWVYQKAGEYGAELTFASAAPDAPLSRIDIHFGPDASTPDQFIARFEATLGAPDARRRKAAVNAYGDHAHDQYDTIWSDAGQYVYLTERLPTGDARGRPVYFLTVKRKEIKAAGPPTGYVPPTPRDKDGRPIEVEPF